MHFMDLRRRRDSKSVVTTRQRNSAVAKCYRVSTADEEELTIYSTRDITSCVFTATTLRNTHEEATTTGVLTICTPLMHASVGRRSSSFCCAGRIADKQKSHDRILVVSVAQFSGPFSGRPARRPCDYGRPFPPTAAGRPFHRCVTARKISKDHVTGMGRSGCRGNGQ